MSELQFKTLNEFVAHLEETDGEHVHKATIIEVLKELSTRKPSGQRRGQLAGLTVEEMTDEQLKREIINANSVLYKAIQRGASADTIEKNQARVDAAKAEKAKREPEVAPEAVTEDEGIYSEDIAEEL
jgi:hypothetical protein